MTTRILIGHCLDVLRDMAAESVHVCVTSPPYYGLRDYGIEPQIWGGIPICQHEWGAEGRSARRQRNGAEGGLHEGRAVDKLADNITLHPPTGAFCTRCNAWRGSLGLEPTPALYVEHMVDVLREVRRVLRQDATLWLVIGDSYANHPASAVNRNGMTGTLNNGRSEFPVRQGTRGSQQRHAIPAGIKPKDLLGIPWALAFALRNDGWYLRSEITWAKRAPMPESVTDRPTSATEKVFLLTKAARYFYDGDAVREPHEDVNRPNGFSGKDGIGHRSLNQGWSGGKVSLDKHRDYNPLGRNMRNFWLLGSEAFPEAHFATFPTEIPRRAILAGTSERGVCPKCGAPWERVVAKVENEGRRGEGSMSANARISGGLAIGSATHMGEPSHATIGWRPTCSCNAGGKYADPIPATVLDPFFGAGTTGYVADRLGRDCVGIELNEAYTRMAADRVADNAGFVFSGIVEVR